MSVCAEQGYLERSIIVSLAQIIKLFSQLSQLSLSSQIIVSWKVGAYTHFVLFVSVLGSTALVVFSLVPLTIAAMLLYSLHFR